MNVYFQTNGEYMTTIQQSQSSSVLSTGVSQCNGSFGVIVNTGNLAKYAFSVTVRPHFRSTDFGSEQTAILDRSLFRPLETAEANEEKENTLFMQTFVNTTHLDSSEDPLAGYLVTCWAKEIGDHREFTKHYSFDLEQYKVNPARIVFESLANGSACFKILPPYDEETMHEKTSHDCTDD